MTERDTHKERYRDETGTVRDKERQRQARDIWAKDERTREI